MTARPPMGWPGLVVVLGALAWGLASDLPSLADPVNLYPRGAFAEGHVLAITLARANLALGAPFSGTTPLLGWPDVAHFRPIVWPMILLGWFMPGAVAYNLFFALVPALNAAGGLLLGRALALDRWGAAAVGGVLAFHPWVTETLANGQLEQSGLGGIAALWACALWAGRGSNLALAMIAPGMSALTFTGPHLGIAAEVGLMLLVAGSVWEARGAGWRRQAVILGLGGIGVGLAGAWYAGNFSARTQVFWPKGSPGHAASLSQLPESATVSGLLFPPAGADAETQTLHPLYLGAFLIVAMALGARRAPRALWLAFGGLLVLAFGEAIGPLPGPFRVLSALSPAIMASQSPYRMLAGVVVAGAAVAAGSIRRGWHLLLFLGIGMVESRMVATRPFLQVAAAHPVDPLPASLLAGAGPVLDLPLLGVKCPDTAYHYATEAGRRVRPTPVLPAAPAHYPTVPALARRVLEAWQARPCGPAMASTAARMGFTTVVLHHHDPACAVQPSFEQCLVDAFGTGETEGGVRVWDVPRTAP